MPFGACVTEVWRMTSLAGRVSACTACDMRVNSSASLPGRASNRRYQTRRASISTLAGSGDVSRRSAPQEKVFAINQHVTIGISAIDHADACAHGELVTYVPDKAEK